MTVSDHLKVLGFVPLSSRGKYQLYLLDLPPSFSLVIEGTYDKKVVNIFMISIL